MSTVARRLGILLALGLGLVNDARAQRVTFYPIPPLHSSGADGSITAGPDGNLWFVGPGANYVGRMTTSGVVTQFPIPTPESGPGAIVAARSGDLWFTEYKAGKIGRITTNGVITEFPIPSGANPEGIAEGADGNLWFTEGYSGKIGRITQAGLVNEYPIPSGNWPFAIGAGADGKLWFSEGYSGRIGRITLDGAISEFAGMDDDNAEPSSFAAGPDGLTWFVGPGSQVVGRIAADGVLAAGFTLPGIGKAPRQIILGPDGALWYSQTRGIGRITVNGEVTEFSAWAIPSGIALGPDGSFWFMTAPGDKIGRLAPGETESLCTPDSRTLCLMGDRFRVEADWQVPTEQRSGHGNAVPLTGDTGSFWFFDENSVEVLVKVLDACALDGHAWIFAAGLTNVGVTLTVTDTQTEWSRSYTNPANTAFQPIQDTAAFSTCP